MQERKITVVIPTFNRFECMRYFFENSFMKYTGELFTFEIHDSSEDNRVKEYIDENIGDSPILKYFKYDSGINGNAKAMRAVLNVKTEYVYLFGDRRSFDFNKWEQWLQENDFHKYLLIGLDAESGKAAGEITICNEATEVFQKFFSSLTCWGGSIVRRSLIELAAEQVEKYIAIESPFTYTCIVFEALAMVRGGVSIFLSANGYGVPTSPIEKNSGCFSCGDTLKVWFYELYHSVMLLPAIYPRDSVFCVGYGDYNFHKLLYWRSAKNLTLQKIFKYKKYISKIAGKKALFKMYLTLLFPVWFLKFGHKIKHKIIK